MISFTGFFVCHSFNGGKLGGKKHLGRHRKLLPLKFKDQLLMGTALTRETSST